MGRRLVVGAGCTYIRREAGGHRRKPQREDVLFISYAVFFFEGGAVSRGVTEGRNTVRVAVSTCRFVPRLVVNRMLEVPAVLGVCVVS